MIVIPSDQRKVTDEDVFSAFDISLPELSGVRNALKNNRTDLAKKELVHYFETRKQPLFYYDYRKQPCIPMEMDENPCIFQAALGLQGNLKEFCLYAGEKLMNHIYVRPGRELEMFLGEQYEQMPHFNYYEDQGKKHRTVTDIFVRGQIFEYLSVLYHETGEERVLKEFRRIFQIFFQTYPLVVDESCLLEGRFSMKEERDIMSTGFLAFAMISLLYTRLPYEIPSDEAFEIIKNLWFLGIQFRRFDEFPYQDYNHHLWEKGLVPYILSVMVPEIPAFASMQKQSIQVINRHIQEDFNENGGYNEHSISYWGGAALGEMLCRGIFLSEKNGIRLLDKESRHRIDATFSVLAAIAPPGKKFPSIGDGGELSVDHVLRNGVQAVGNHDCKQVLELRSGKKDIFTDKLKLDYCDDTCGFACSHSTYEKDENYFLMSVKKNCGSSGHNHMDMLSMNVVFRGEEFIGEPYARSIYHKVRMGSDIRGYLYNMTSHNTVLAYGNPVVPDQCFANKWGVFRPDTPVDNFFSGKKGSYLEAHHDAYGCCRHVRRVLFHREKGIVLEDEILRGNRMPHAHIQRWHLMPDVVCSKIDSNHVLLEKNGVKVLCVWSGKPEIRLWKKETLCPEIFEDSSCLGTTIDVLFSPFEQGDMASVCQRMLMVDVTEDRLASIKKELLDKRFSVSSKQELEELLDIFLI